MDYFIAENATKRISKFRDAYLRALDARAKDDASAFEQATIEMATISHLVRRDLRRIDSLTEFYLEDAPKAGGRVLSIDIVSLATQPEVAEHYDISAIQIRVPLESAIGEYKWIRQRAFRDLFNPFWWIGSIFAQIVRVPLYILGWAGFNRESLEATKLGQVYTRVTRLFVIVIVIFVAAFLVNSQTLAWLDNLLKALSSLLGPGTTP